MKIELNQVGKRYRLEWIFKNLNYTFLPQHSYAILGSNGSGKSTLMKILSGHLSPSKGIINFSLTGNEIEKDKVFAHVTFAAPYIDLIEEFSLIEMLQFQMKFKPFIQEMSLNDVVEIIQLPNSAKHKEIRFFSSGMKQRMKLALAILSESSLLLLDEPTTNLDTQGMEWYLELVQKYTSDKTVIVASNEERDFTFCKYILNIMDYKPQKRRRK